MTRCNAVEQAAAPSTATVIVQPSTEVGRRPGARGSRSIFIRRE